MALLASWEAEQTCLIWKGLPRGCSMCPLPLLPSGIKTARGGHGGEEGSWQRGGLAVTPISEQLCTGYNSSGCDTYPPWRWHGPKGGGMGRTECLTELTGLRGQNRAHCLTACLLYSFTRLCFPVLKAERNSGHQHPLTSHGLLSTGRPNRAAMS